MCTVDVTEARATTTPAKSHATRFIEASDPLNTSTVLPYAAHPADAAYLAQNLISVRSLRTREGPRPPR